MRLRWTRTAQRDIRLVAEYIGAESPRASGKMILRIRSQTEALAALPHLGRTGRVAGTRELVIADSPYIVAYRVHYAELEILAVMHGARKWPEHLH